MFVWKKREEKRKKLGETSTASEQQDDRLRQWELRQELERAKRRRLLREQGKVSDKKEPSLNKASKEDEEDWELLEDIFHAEQNLKKQEIRLKEGRPQLVDLLAQNGRFDLDPRFVSLNPPYVLLENLPLERLNSLREELEEEKSYAIALATPAAKKRRRKNVFESLPFAASDYWSDILSVLDLVKARLEQQATKASKSTSDSFQVIQEACAFLEEKSLEELEEMKLAIQKELNEGTAVDTEYWEFLLQNIDVFKSKFSLRMKHIQLLQRKVSLVDRILASRENPNDIKCDITSDLSTSQLYKLKQSIEEAIRLLKENPNDPALRSMDEMFISHLKQSESTNIVDESTDNGDVRKEELLLERERAKGLEEDEEVFMDEVEVKSNTSSKAVSVAEDKSRPRKPKYFNRVLTGYEWNKYNQTHYDHDNPPPKTVQGYKFNIFYTNLDDPSKAPTYTIEKTDNPDICIIRFSAGPPYQDIAFKIVNREWERSHRKGFKCCFERGILHLWFNFKKYRYRR